MIMFCWRELNKYCARSTNNLIFTDLARIGHFCGGHAIGRTSSSVSRGPGKSRRLRNVNHACKYIEGDCSPRASHCIPDVRSSSFTEVWNTWVAVGAPQANRSAPSRRHRASCLISRIDRDRAVPGTISSSKDWRGPDIREILFPKTFLACRKSRCGKNVHPATGSRITRD